MSKHRQQAKEALRKKLQDTRRGSEKVNTYGIEYRSYQIMAKGFDSYLRVMVWTTTIQAIGERRAVGEKVWGQLYNAGSGLTPESRVLNKMVSMYGLEQAKTWLIANISYREIIEEERN